MKQEMRAMKVWAWVIGALVAIWSVVWLVGSIATERLLTGWLADREAAGWVVTRDTVQTSGYPFHFITTLPELMLADPQSGWAVEADGFRLEQDSYQPQAIRAVWPAEHTLSTPFEHITIRAEQLEAMLHIRPLDYLALEQSETRITALEMESDIGWSSRLDRAVALVAERHEPGHRYDIRIDASGVDPAGAVLALLDPAGVLPQSIELVHLDAIMGFDRIWDLTALESSRPAITRVELTELRAEWGQLALRLSGDLDVDAEGMPMGDLSVRAQNWRAMIEIGVNAGAIPASFRGTLETGLGLLAGLSGRPEDLDATLSFSDGQVYFGPIPLGPAPRLILR
ncbi:DUF2125 domain-containing protein [Nioella aestuarii]